MSMKKSVGRVVGKLNEYLRGKEGKVMAVGPGRWGSSNIDLGVNVSYADIDNMTVLWKSAAQMLVTSRSYPTELTFSRSG